MGKTEKYDHMKLIRMYAGGHRNLITLGRCLAAVSAVMTLIPYYELWKIIRCAVNGENLDDIRVYAWSAVALIVGALLVYIAALFCTHIAAFRVQANMRSTLMHRIITLPLGVFDEDGTGKIRRIVNDSTAATETYIAHNLPDKTVAAVTSAGLLVLVFAFNWRIGLICMIPAVIGFLCLRSMMGKGMQEKMKEYQDALENMSSEATEYVRGVPVVKTFGQTVHSFKRFKECIDGFGKWATQYTLMLRFPMAGFMTCINAIFAFIVIAAFVVTRNGVDNAAILNIMYYIIITPLVTIALTKIAYSGEAEMTLIDAMKRVDSIMEIEQLPEGKTDRKPADHGIELKNVSYHYKDATRDAVNDVSLSIKPGEHVALVGPSGSGKTTLAELMVRFFDVTSGEILVGGVNVKDLSSKTLMENIRIGKSGATDEEVMEAAGLANCDEFVKLLPNQYNTNIGENGSELSGGERQRISIARAFLKDAPVILLDEATASLDAENETVIQEALSRLIKNKTVMIIAHRMRTIAKADHIVVLGDGVVAEQGSPEFLSGYDSMYSRMTAQQLISQNWTM